MSDDREGKNWCVLLSGGERKGRYRPILFKKMFYSPMERIRTY
jgi:hypothetical protein